MQDSKTSYFLYANNALESRQPQAADPFVGPPPPPQAPSLGPCDGSKNSSTDLNRVYSKAVLCTLQVEPTVRLYLFLIREALV